MVRLALSLAFGFLLLNVALAVPLSKQPALLQISSKLSTEPCGEEDPECCNGLTCPFVEGVCCKDSQHCCPKGGRCVEPEKEGQNMQVMCATPKAPPCHTGRCGHNANSACDCPAHCQSSACADRPHCCPQLAVPACACPEHCHEKECEHRPPCCPHMNTTKHTSEEQKAESQQSVVVAPSDVERLRYQPTQPKSTPPATTNCCPSHCVHSKCDKRPACCPPLWQPKMDYESSMIGGGAGVAKVLAQVQEKEKKEVHQQEPCGCARAPENTLSPCACAGAAKEAVTQSAQHDDEAKRMQADFAKGAFLAAQLM